MERRTRDGFWKTLSAEGSFVFTCASINPERFAAEVRALNYCLPKSIWPPEEVFFV